MEANPPLRFCEAIDKVFRQNYANFNGRARRSEYWFWYLFNILVESVLFLPAQVFKFQQGQIPVVLTVMYYIYIGFFIITFIPGLAVTVRRLHDIGKSGWWILIVFIPFVGAIILLVFTCFDSEHGPNEWGDSPKYTVTNLGNQETMV